MLNTFTWLKTHFPVIEALMNHWCTVTVSGCVWDICAFLPSPIVVRNIVKVSHCPACQIVFSVIPTCGAKFFPGVVLVNFHTSKRWDPLCPKAHRKRYSEKYYGICISVTGFVLPSKIPWRPSLLSNHNFEILFETFFNQTLYLWCFVSEHLFQAPTFTRPDILIKLRRVSCTRRRVIS